LAHRHPRSDVVDLVRRRLRHAPGPQGEEPRRSQPNATSLSWPQSPPCGRRTPWARSPHASKATKLALQAAPGQTPGSSPGTNSPPGLFES
jgi:hypothetical protein